LGIDALVCDAEFILCMSVPTIL